MADIEQVLLQQLADKGSIADTGDFAAELKQDHLKVVGVIKSLEMAEMIAVQVSRGQPCHHHVDKLCMIVDPADVQQEEFLRLIVQHQRSRHSRHWDVLQMWALATDEVVPCKATSAGI